MIKTTHKISVFLVIILALFLVGCEKEIEYTIQFEANDGSVVEPITQVFGKEINNPKEPTKLGNSFRGWHSDSGLTESFTFNKMPEENIILYAKWEINSYTINFEENEGSNVSNLKQEYNTLIVSPETSKNGYTFIGWFSNSSLTDGYVFSRMPAENITLYAKWKIKQYKIGFEENGGAAVSDKTQDYNTSVTEPETSKAGFTFIGWFTDSELTESFVFSTMPAENITLYAKWEMNQYTISFEENGGTVVNEITQEPNTTVRAPEISKEGFAFVGWYSDEKLLTEYIFSKMPTYDIKLYAKWLETGEATLDIDYELNVDTYIVKSYAGKEEHVVIPAIYNGKSVTSIGEQAFANLPYLTSIIIPNSITTIGNGAFAFCTGLIDVTIPSSVTSIGNKAFWYCTALTNITIPNSVTIIEDELLGYCKNLKNFTIPNSIISIGAYAFFNCTGFTSMEFPNNLQIIGNGAFAGCLNLENILIPNSVTNIENYAFGHCQSFTNITIPNTVQSLGDEAFMGCINLTNIILPNSINKLNKNLFKDCTGLTSFIIPSHITIIGDGAFRACSNLVNITIPIGVTSIGNRSFMGCISLTNVSIPDTVKTIDHEAFSYCSSLTSIIIPINVYLVESFVFSYCTNMTTIYCEASQTKWDWNEWWNYAEILVVWDYKK